VRASTILSIALSAIAGLGVAFSPYTPFTAAQLHEMLGLPGEPGGEGWKRPEIAAGSPLGVITPLFTKLDELQ
jgi:methionyl-tRNA synthetase